MIIIHDNNGAITQTVSDPVPPGHAEFLTGEGHLFIEVETYPSVSDIYEKHHVVDGALALRPILDLPSNLALTVGDSYTFEALPDPCTVELDGETLEVTGGQVEITADMPATYELIFSAWPHLTHVTKVTINAA